MSTGSKVVLLLSFVFIGVLVWYYGPSSTTTDQIIEDPVLQSSPAVSVDTRPDPTPTPTPAPTLTPTPTPRTTDSSVVRSGSNLTMPRPQPPMGPMPRTTTSFSGAPSYLVMGQPVTSPTLPAPVSPATARLRTGPGSAAPTVPAATTIATTVQVQPTAAARTYVVAAGDTLSGISVTYYGTETQWNRIADANPQVDPDRLRIGTRLKIPAYTPRSARAARPAASSTTSRPLPPGTRSHRVEDGESLSSIADQYYGRETQWTTIFEANREMLKGDPDRLRIGMVLAIPTR